MIYENKGNKCILLLAHDLTVSHRSLAVSWISLKSTLTSNRNGMGVSFWDALLPSFFVFWRPASEPRFLREISFTSPMEDDAGVTDEEITLADGAV